ncbi:uncharacterized protein LOC135109188 [Scylla paramamosain]|uniref:WXXXRamide n=1 Tax=Scylla paramamosain TaxID=85552 RepID=A0A0S2YRB5_SCYPA|nr:WXXXRamide [Scylla paramamosain]
MASVFGLLVMALAAALAATAQELSPGEAGSSEGQAWEGHRHARSLETGGDASWLSGLQDADVTQVEPRVEAGHGGTTFWVARGKKDAENSPTYYWGPNQGLWGETFQRGTSATASSSHTPLAVKSGWESNPSLWGKRDGRGPFWAARGKRPDPFWASRGRRDSSEMTSALLQQWAAEDPTMQEQKEDQLWSGEIKREEGGPFWISRGKRPQPGSAASQLASLWAIRGRKSGADNTFWAARGKKETNVRGPFWAARGKRSGGEGGTGPYWIARGKKQDGNTPTGPYWIARGKKEDDGGVFWAARGKKDPPAWATGRGRREDAANSFWIARGKKSEHAASHNTEKDNDDDDDEEQHEEVTQKAADHYLKGFTALSGK